MATKPLTIAELDELAAGLNRVAHNLWWTWDQGAQDVFGQLSPRGWQNLFHNAVAVLREVSAYELRVRLQDEEFAAQVRTVLRDFDAYLAESHTWAGKHAPQFQKNPVAYFSAEFGFHETLPIAAGGLGVLAGDHMKSASDLGLGLVGISLFYREGYFQQAIDANNWQTEFYSLLDPTTLPVEPVLDASGQPLTVTVKIAMSQVWVRAWRVNVGRVPVYLLDTDHPRNEPHIRDLTRRVYGGDSTVRIMQEILLGVGGVRALKALGIEPEAYHMNEGHCANLVLERCRQLVAEHGVPFRAAA
jgi:starch phosphorylase